MTGFQWFAKWLSVMAFMVTCMVPVPGQAAAIGFGFDLLATPQGGAFLPANVIPGQPEITLVGNPIGPGNTDTIFERRSDLPDNATGVIQAEIVALSLTSTEPVEIMGSSFDVFVTLDPGTPSQGEIVVTEHFNGGGLFDSSFDVFWQIDFVEVGGTTPVTAFYQDQIASMDSEWSHTPPPLYPSDPRYPSGGFYPAGSIMFSGPHVRTDPAVIPEPSTYVLFGAGLLAIMGFARKKMKA